MTTRLAQIAVCDSFSPAFPDLGAFVDSVCSAVAIEWRRAGVDGIRILDVELHQQLLTSPGQAPLDRAAVKSFLEQNRRKQ
ncbi:hypothetical protein GTW51_14935 [Aurantimonas aggregata]|uniref:Uncharacterized protein n=1 Tax=Aurantimonas aggregata TaxID=2047720 RepID=A0A6L9MKA5_9HYPH|nr:hypothetical protein [Aurantimonas aggregata]NDV87998.1 hypothetical protein [Aurantimonas aggregata]